MKDIKQFILESESNNNLVNDAKNILSDEYIINPAKGKIQGIKIDVKTDKKYHYTISLNENKKLWFIRRYNKESLNYSGVGTVIGWDKKQGSIDNAGFESFDDAINKFIEYMENKK